MLYVIKYNCTFFSTSILFSKNNLHTYCYTVFSQFRWFFYIHLIINNIYHSVVTNVSSHKAAHHYRRLNSSNLIDLARFMSLYHSLLTNTLQDFNTQASKLIISQQATKNDSNEPLIVCQSGQRVSWVILYHPLKLIWLYI